MYRKFVNRYQNSTFAIFPHNLWICTSHLEALCAFRHKFGFPFWGVNTKPAWTLCLKSMMPFGGIAVGPFLDSRSFRLSLVSRMPYPDRFYSSTLQGVQFALSCLSALQSNVFQSKLLGCQPASLNQLLASDVSNPCQESEHVCHPRF